MLLLGRGAHKKLDAAARAEVAAGRDDVDVDVERHRRAQVRRHGQPGLLQRGEQAPHLGLDNVSEKAQSTLIQLGNSDALEIYGKVIADNPNYKVVKDIFNQMPELKESV